MASITESEDLHDLSALFEAEVSTSYQSAISTITVPCLATIFLPLPFLIDYFNRKHRLLYLLVQILCLVCILKNKFFNCR